MRAQQTGLQRLQRIANKNEVCIRINTTKQFKLSLPKTSSTWLQLSSLAKIDVDSCNESCIQSCCGDLPREEVVRRFATAINDVSDIKSDFDCESESDWVQHFFTDLAFGEGQQVVVAHGLSLSGMRLGALRGAQHFLVQTG